MSMPRFTAEASLYKSLGRYRAATSVVRSSAQDRVVHPARPIVPVFQCDPEFFGKKFCELCGGDPDTVDGLWCLRFEVV